jgi:hypothetical protein
VKKITVVLLASVTLLVSCVDISGGTPSASVNADTDGSEQGEIYKTYRFSENDESFLAETVFAGDSLAADLSGFGLAQTVISDTEMSPETMGDYKSQDGPDIITALINSDAAHVAIMFRAGNESGATACVDYTKRLRAWVPNISVYVLSAPPVSENEKNGAINEYNLFLKRAIEELGDDKTHYVEIGVELKNASGALKSMYATEAGSDRLTEKAYHAVLWQLCRYAESEQPAN